jgi:putative transposase
MPTMKIQRGLRYKLHPTPEQVQRFEHFAGVSRLIYNLALEQRRDFWRQHKATVGTHISHTTQSREVTALRAAYDWIEEVPSDCAGYAIRDLDRAFQSFFSGRSGYPRFRRKGDRDGFRLKGVTTAVRTLNAKWAELRVPKLGWVKMRLTRPLIGQVRNVQIVREGGSWFASFAAEWEQEQPTTEPASVGIDRGVASTLSLSNGEHIQAPDNTAPQRRIARAKQTLSRRKRGSKRYAAQRAKLARLTSKAARIRSDWCHRVSTDIARRFGLVAIEALNIKGMTASASGTVEEPGRNVAQKRRLNRSILEQSWGKFAALLDYKLAERGGILVSVPAAYTSQTCAACGVVDGKSRESQSVFRCVHCGHEDNADRNAALEILRRSTSGLDVEAGVARPSKRQPKESANA